MTYDEWVETYKPVKNTFSGDILFQEFDDIPENQNPLTIWTDYVYDGKNYIINDIFSTNAMGYYVTEIPANKGETVLIIIGDWDYGEDED